MICYADHTQPEALDQLYLADIYPHRFEPSFAIWNQQPEEYVIGHFLTRLDRVNPRYSKLLEAALARLKFVFIDTVPEFEDDFLRLPKNCKKFQLALQNKSDGTVFVNREFFQLLSPAQKGLLKLHEGMISLMKESGDTSSLRSFISYNTLGFLAREI